MSDDRVKAVVKFVLGILITPPLLLWHGWVTIKLWDWFVVPIFDLPHLSMAYAVGLSLIVALLAADPPDLEWEKLVARAISRPAGFLLFGWVTTLFM